MPCLYLHYEPKVQNKDYKDIKYLFNEVDNDIAATTIKTVHIHFKLLTTIKNHLSYSQN